jgi:hypothetical protein
VDDSFGYIAYLLILAIVGIVTVIRKVFERSASGEPGKKFDLARAVQDQIDRYMKAGSGTRMGTGGLGGQEPPAPVATAGPPVPVMTTRQPPPPVRKPPPRKPVPVQVEAPGILRQSLASEAGLPAIVQRRKRRPKLTVKEVKKAVLMAEILGPPMAERRDYRLF